MNQSFTNPFEFTYSVWLPANLDIDNLLVKNKIDVVLHRDNPNKIRDRLAFVLGTLTHIFEKQIEEGNIQGTEEWIRLCSKYLQPSIRDYRKYLDFALRTGVLEEGKKYSNPISCTEYRFSAKYQRNWRKRYYILDTGLVFLIYKHRQHPAAIRKYPHQFKCIKGLSVDWNVANPILDSTFGKDKIRREQQIQRLKAIEDPRKATYKVGKTNRLYTTLCNIDKKLRPCLRFSGQRLVGIDISNSIPFFLIALFDKYVYMNERIDILLRDINNRIFGGSGPHARWFILVDIQNNKHKFPDVKRYIELVRDNQLYDLLITEWNQTLGTQYDRNSAKEKLLEIFNSPPHHQSGERSILEQLFPSVMKVINLINTGYFKTKGGKGKSKWHPGDQECPFAHVTQKLEARVVLDYVCKAIELHDPDIPIFTLHDCIFTIPEHVETLKAIMEHEIQQVMGFPPKVSIKD